MKMYLQVVVGLVYKKQSVLKIEQKGNDIFFSNDEKF